MKARKRGAVLGGIAAGVGWLLYRRWNQSFYNVRIEDIQINDQTGRPQPGKRVRVQSILDAPPEVVWAKVTTPALLVFVTYPILSFKTQDGAPLPEVWREGDTLYTNLFALGFIALGSHAIYLERVDAKKYEIQSREAGQMAEIWWHYVSAQPYPDDRTLYTDEIDIYAGSFTGAVACFASFFYRYRQTRWRKLLRALKAQQTKSTDR